MHMVSERDRQTTGPQRPDARRSTMRWQLGGARARGPWPLRVRLRGARADAESGEPEPSSRQECGDRGCP